MWPSRPKWVTLLLVHFWGTAIFPKGLPCIDFGFTTESVSPVFSTSENTLVTHAQSLQMSLVCASNKQPSNNGYIRTLFGDFSLKLTRFGVCDFTLSYFQNQWIDLDNFLHHCNENSMLCTMLQKISKSQIVSARLISGGRVTYEAAGPVGSQCVTITQCLQLEGHTWLHDSAFLVFSVFSIHGTIAVINARVKILRSIN